MDPEIVVAFARFQQQDLDRRVLGQPLCQQAAGAARTDDDVIELPLIHVDDVPCYSPLSTLMCAMALRPSACSS